MASKKTKAARPAKQDEPSKSTETQGASFVFLTYRIARLQSDLDAALTRIASLEARPVHYWPTQPPPVPPATPWWCFWSAKDAAD